MVQCDYMSYRNIAFSENEFYHVYNRGTDKRVIFLDSNDYERFLQLLYLSNSSQSINVRDIRKNTDDLYEYDRGEPLVSIGAYCLMPNHFHILLTPQIQDGVSHYMRKLSTSYAMYFNKKYERSGSLFQGKFKAKHADSDEYLKYLFSYIHLNPTKLFATNNDDDSLSVEESILSNTTDYQYSSLKDYLYPKSRAESRILHEAPFPEYFSNNKDINKELYEWIELSLLQP